MIDHDPHRFHDNPIHGIAFRIGDPEAGDWTSDLVLDIDHITWGAITEEGPRFRVAPATLTFHDVTDLAIRTDQGTEGHRVAIALPWILAVDREPVADQKVHSDRPYHAWRIRLAAHPAGAIVFGSSGYTLVLRGDPILSAEQYLTTRQRSGATQDR